MKLLKAFYWPFKRHTIFRIICSQAWATSAMLKVTMHWNGALVEARHHHKHLVFSAQHPFATDFFLKCDRTLSIKMHFGKVLVANTTACCQECTGFIVWIIFWTNGKWNWKTHIFWYSMATQWVLGQWISIIIYFQTPCKLSKFTIRDMPFETILSHWLIREGKLTVHR